MSENAWRRPNVVVFIADRLRADCLGCYGNPVIRTPNIDGLARSGVTFTRAYINSPLCMPHRSTFMTGRTPRGHGVRTNGIPLDRSLPTVPQALREAGYVTHAIGKMHLNPFGTPRGADPASFDPAILPESREYWESGRIQNLPLPYYGFESVDFIGGHGAGVWGHYRNWLRSTHPGAERLLQPVAAEEPPTGAESSWKMSLPAELHYNDWIADRAMRFLQERAGEDRPFFLWCSFPDPHPPFAPPEPWHHRYHPDDVPMPARREGELDDLPPHYGRVARERLLLAGRLGPTQISDDHIREIRAHYYGLISHVDACVGRVIEELDRLNLRDDTLVLFINDHGDLLGDHWLIGLGCFHLQGIVRWASVWSWPRRFVEGQQNGAMVSGLDLAPTLLDVCGVPIPEGWVSPEPESPLQPPPWPGRSLLPLLQGQQVPWRDAVVIENDEDYLGLRLRTLVTPQYKLTAYPGQPYGELFLLEDDPQELYNRWHDPGLRLLRLELQACLMEELTLTDSALPRRICHA